MRCTTLAARERTAPEVPVSEVARAKGGARADALLNRGAEATNQAALLARPGARVPIPGGCVHISGRLALGSVEREHYGYVRAAVLHAHPAGTAACAWAACAAACLLWWGIGGDGSWGWG